MDRFNFVLMLAIIALSKPCHTSDINNAILYSNGIPNVAVVDQPQLIQTTNSDNIVITPPDYLNLNNQVSFAAPVGAQHPNQKPQPEPRPPPYEPNFRHYHDHSVHIDSGHARSYVQYQRTFY